jgi:hypothetical protein
MSGVNVGQNPQKDDEEIHRRIPVYFTQQKKGADLRPLCVLITAVG